MMVSTDYLRLSAAGSRMPMTGQAGVALLQVLLLAAVLVLLSIQLSHSAREQIRIAAALEARVKADLASLSLRNRYIFTELTAGSPSSVRGDSGLLNSGHKELDQLADQTVGVAVDARDISGLLPFRYFQHPLWIPYLKSIGFSEEESAEFVVTMSDAQDGDNYTSEGGDEPQLAPWGSPYLNRSFQDYGVLELWPGLTDRQIAAIRANSHLYPLYSVNVAEMPNELGAALRSGAVDKEGDVSAGLDQLVRRYDGQEFVEALTENSSAVRRFAVTWQQGDLRIQQSWDVYLGGRGGVRPYEILAHDRF